MTRRSLPDLCRPLYKQHMAKKKSVTKKQTPEVYEFTITLSGTTPSVWRKVLAHEIIQLDELHLLIQMTMGWKDSHLYSFLINGKTYSGDEEFASEIDAETAEGVLLCDVLGSTKVFQYTYDFGDNWVHYIEIKQVLEHDPRLNYPVCIGGANACPPEDCGGIHGFEELKETLSGPASEEQDELLAWVGGFYSPTTFDPNFVNQYLLWAE